jgi:hypothetical protein
MLLPARRTRISLCLLLAAIFASGQDFEHERLVTRGKINLDGHEHAYVVRHLPPSSFPDLPVTVAGELTERGCLIPQTYEAHRPENAIHGSFERPGSSDWAVLCSVKGKVSLLVFFAAAPGKPAVLAADSETGRLQIHDPSGVLGFNWGIDAATPETVHEAQIGISPRPPALDHDAIADSVIDHTVAYHYFSKGVWTLAQTAND